LIEVNEGKQLRFALGARNDPCSSAWRIWTQGDEAYVAVRTSITVAKLSLHSNGYWPFRVGNNIVGYRRPAQSPPGWTRGPGILIAHNDLDLRLPYYDPRPLDHITWLSQPAAGHVAQFAIRIVDASVPSRDWLDPVLAGGAAIAALKLRSLGRLCVHRLDRRLTAEEASQVAMRRTILESKHPETAPERVFGISNITVQPDSRGQTMLFETQIRPLRRPGAT
jgi:hypothetical protein